MNIVDKMIDYRNTNNADILGSVQLNDPTNLTVIVIEILSWLKLECKREIWIERGRTIRHKPLMLNMDYPWCVDLVNLLQENNALSEVFCIVGKSMSFKDSVSIDYIHEAWSLAYKKYNPRMVIG